MFLDLKATPKDINLLKGENVGLKEFLSITQAQVDALKS